MSTTTEHTDDERSREQKENGIKKYKYYFGTYDPIWTVTESSIENKSNKNNGDE